MLGMHKWLWHTFCLVVIAYFLFKEPRIVVEIAMVVFIGGGLFLTVFAYVCAKISMPRKATDSFPKKMRDK
jgi:hypothetical protein